MRNYKNVNIGIEILRILMAFEVVIYHMWSSKVVGFTHTPLDQIVTHIFSSYYLIAVPVFTIISFSFVDFEKVVSKTSSIKSRLTRIIIPHLFYTFFYSGILFITNNLCHIENPISLDNVKEQLTTGAGPFVGTMWFQIALLIITFIYIIIYKFIPKYSTECVLLLGVICFYLSYNANWINFLQLHISFPLNQTLGRTVELFPMASVGVLLRKSKVMNKDNGKGNLILIVALITLLYFILYTDNIFAIYHGYAYAGLSKIIIATLTILLFNYIGQYIKLDILKKGISTISMFTMGVYGLHPIVSYFFKHTIVKNGFYTFFDCVGIYVVSTLVAFLLSKIKIKFIRNSMI